MTPQNPKTHHEIKIGVRVSTNSRVNVTKIKKPRELLKSALRFIALAWRTHNLIELAENIRTIVSGLFGKLAAYLDWCRSGRCQINVSL